MSRPGDRNAELRLQAAWLAEALHAPLAETMAPKVADILRERPPVPRLAYSIDEVAEALGVSPRKVNDLVRSGSLPSVQLDGRGSRRIVRAEALTAFLDRLEAETTNGLYADLLQSPHSAARPGLAASNPPSGREAGRTASSRRRHA